MASVFYLFTRKWITPPFLEGVVFCGQNPEAINKNYEDKNYKYSPSQA